MPPLNGCAGYGTNQPGCATPRCACADGGRRKLRHALERRERRPKKGTRHDCWRWRLGGSRTFEANAGCAWMSSASNGWFVIAGRADGAPLYVGPAYSKPPKQVPCLPVTGHSPAGTWDRRCIEAREAAVVRPLCLAGALRAGGIVSALAVTVGCERARQPVAGTHKGSCAGLSSGARRTRIDARL